MLLLLCRPRRSEYIPRKLGKEGALPLWTPFPINSTYLLVRVSILKDNSTGMEKVKTVWWKKNVAPAGLELTTSEFLVQRSNQLSHRSATLWPIFILGIFRRPPDLGQRQPPGSARTFEWDPH
uniref:Uncharacterized protein n=1 Tax=Lygus hesperus TaxID=30085 RepID=A0A146LRZ2_LYGHE